MKVAPYVYLASPYSHDDPEVRRQRYEAAKQAVAQIAALGVPVYSPIVHWHSIALENGLPTDAAFWQTQNDSLMLASGGIWIFCLDGWRQSKGVEAEIKFAELNDLPTTYFIIDTIEESVRNWKRRYAGHF